MSIPFGYGAQPTSQQIALRRILFVDRYAGIKPSSPDSTDSGLQELPAVAISIAFLVNSAQGRTVVIWFALLARGEAS